MHCDIRRYFKEALSHFIVSRDNEGEGGYYSSSLFFATVLVEKPFELDSHWKHVERCLLQLSCTDMKLPIAVVIKHVC